MRKLWHDIQAHKWAAVLFVVYWLATLVVVHSTWAGGIPDPVVALLFTTPLIAGFLVGRWRASTPERAAGSGDVMRGGTLAGVLSAAMTLVVMKGGVVDEVIGWIRGWEFFGQWGEVLEFTIAAAVLGAVLGLVGATLAVVVDRRRRLGRRSLPT
jgi:Na+/citrate or Na+/malate symporter